MAREGNNPKRRIAELDTLTPEERQKLSADLIYVGSGHHKRFPANYGFSPPVSPRPSKSICDGIRIILQDEAEQLLRSGVSKGMFSELSEHDFPKYVWSVDNNGEAYEAKTNPNNPGKYYGYRLEEEDAMRERVQKIWKRRCQQAGQ